DGDDDAVPEEGVAIDSGTDAATSTLGADTICSRSIARETSYWIDGATIRYGASEVKLYGLNWFGLETPDRAPHGLWMRPLDAIPRAWAATRCCAANRVSWCSSRASATIPAPAVRPCSGART